MRSNFSSIKSHFRKFSQDSNPRSSKSRYYSPIKILDFEQASSSDMMYNLKLPARKIKEIKEKIKLEDEVLANFKQREKYSDWFMMLDVNQFTFNMHEQNKKQQEYSISNKEKQVKKKQRGKIQPTNYGDSKSQQSMDPQKLKSKKSIKSRKNDVQTTEQRLSDKMKHLIKHLDNIRQKDKKNQRNIRSPIQKMKKQKQFISNSLTSSIFSKIPTRQSNFNLIFNQSIINNLIEQNLEASSTNDFQNIINIEQQSYYVAKLRNQNVYQIIFKTKDEIMNDRSQINKYYFCFESTIEGIGRHKIPFTRDLSNNARNIARRMKHQSSQTNYINKNQIIVNSQNIIYESMLGIASGRFNCNDVTKMLDYEFQIQKQQTNSQQEQQKNKKIYYNQHLTHAKTNFSEPFEEEIQSNIYKQLEKKKKEEKYIKNLDSSILKYKYQLQKEKKMKLFNIEDKIIKNKINQQKQQILKQLLGQKCQQKLSVQSKIRKNKRNRYQGQSLRVQSVLQLVSRTKEIQDKMKNRILTPPKEKNIWR